MQVGAPAVQSLLVKQDFTPTLSPVLLLELSEAQISLIQVDPPWQPTSVLQLSPVVGLSQVLSLAHCNPMPQVVNADQLSPTLPGETSILLPVELLGIVFPAVLPIFLVVLLVFPTKPCNPEPNEIAKLIIK